MADKKISELTELTTPDGTEELVVNDSGVSKKVQIDNLLAGGTITNFTSTGIDDNATSTAITLDASENVGIGTTTPTATLNISSSTDASIDINATNGTTQDAFIRFESPDNGTAYFGIDDSLQLLKINNTSGLSVVNHLVIDNAGKVGIGTSSPAKPLDVTGDIRTSTGILFGTDTAAANALDDYEEGTWTPELVNGTSITYNSQSGKYVKIGSVVHVECYINVSNSSTGDGSNVAVSGLPYSVDILSGSACPTFGINIYDNTFLDIATHGAAHLNFLSTALVLDFTYSQCNTSGKLRMSATYRV
jgi:hypothetical protein